MGQVLSCDRCGNVMPYRDAVKVMIRGPQTERRNGQERDWDLCKPCQEVMGISFHTEIDEIGTRLTVPELAMPTQPENPEFVDTEGNGDSDE